jgi:hypothetical protein
MTILSVEECRTTRRERAHAHGSPVRAFLVRCDDPRDGPLLISRAADPATGLTIPRFFEPLPGDDGYRVSDVDARRQRGRGRWRVLVRYHACFTNGPDLGPRPQLPADVLAAIAIHYYLRPYLQFPVWIGLPWSACEYSRYPCTQCPSAFRFRTWRLADRRGRDFCDVALAVCSNPTCRTVHFSYRFVGAAVIHPPLTLSEEARRRLREEWMRLHNGPDHGLISLPEGTYTVDDSAHAQICRLVGMPPDPLDPPAHPLPETEVTTDDIKAVCRSLHDAGARIDFNQEGGFRYRPSEPPA